jgi:DNA-binding cell septation regulator SpoVG
MNSTQLRRGERLWGTLPDARRHPRQPRLKDCIPHRSGSMLAFLSVELASGMIVNGLRLMTGTHGPWIAMPSQKLLDRDGKPRLDGGDKSIYSPILEFRDHATADRFAAMVIEVVRRQRPEALEGPS